MSIKISYSARTTKKLNKNKLSKDIMQAIKGSPELRKEIKRVFQVANRRIQNLEKSGIMSPAVIALGERGTWSRFSKFSIKHFGNEGESWESLKRQYAKAISFLNQATSTVTGAKEFKNHVQKQTGITDKKLFDSVYDSIARNKSSLDRKLMYAQVYRTMIENIYSTVSRKTSNQIESDSQEIANEMERNIKQVADEMANEVDSRTDEILNSLLKGFKL